MSQIIDPATLSPSGRYAADSITGTDGAVVSTWPDSSGNSRDLSQSTAANKPLVFLGMGLRYSNAGHKVVWFDGTDDYLESAVNLSALLGTDGVGTAILVFTRVSGSSEVVRGLWGGTGGTSASQMRMAADPLPLLAGSVYGAGGLESAIVPLPVDLSVRSSYSNYAPYPPSGTTFSGVSDWHVACWQHASAAGVHSVLVGLDNLDDAALGVRTAEADAALGAVLKVGRNHEGNYFFGYIAELIFFPTVLTETQRRGVQLYLTNKYAIAYGSSLADEGPVATSMKVEIKLPSSTLQLTPSAWYKADAIQGLVNGDPVATWPDSSGNSRDITQATPADRPLYQTNKLNGLPAVLFDGAGDLLAGTFTLGDIFKAGGMGTVYFVGKPSTVAGSPDYLHLLWSAGSGATPTRMTVEKLSLDSPDRTFVYAYAYDGTEDYTNHVTYLGDWHVYVWSKSWTYLYLRGDDFSSGAWHAETASGALADLGSVLNVGGQAGLANYFDGLIAEILVFPGEHSSVMMRHVHSYLAEKYALPYPDGDEYEPVFVDVTSDIRENEGLTFQYGISGGKATDRTASSGSAEFYLENSVASSGGVQGYYSPDSANRRPGFVVGAAVRISFEYYGTRYYKWYGRISSIRPNPGKHRRVSQVIARDYIDELSRCPVGTANYKPEAQLDRTASEIFATLLVYVPAQLPPTFMIGRSVDIYPYALDNVRDEELVTLSECNRLAMSELGRVYVCGDTLYGGRLVFEPRDSRIRPAQWPMADTDIRDLSFEHSAENVVNRATISVHPRRADTTTVVLFSLGGAVGQSIKAKETLVFDAPYRDPDTSRSARVGGTAMIDPVATTDYLFYQNADGTGTNRTAQLSVTATFGASSATITCTNNGTTNGFLTKMQLRGKGLYSFEDVTVTQIDNDSMSKYGVNTFSMDMPYQNDTRVAGFAAMYMVSQDKDPHTRVREVSFLPNRTSYAMMHALAREISDQVTITETASGLSSERYFIQAIGFQIREGKMISVRWSLVPGTSEGCWILELPGNDELGETTTLSYNT